MIELSDVAALAELYDGYANAIQRLSADRLLARRQFYARLELLYERENAGVPTTCLSNVVVAFRMADPTNRASRFYRVVQQ